MNSNTSLKERVRWVDTVKGIGMVLVFYGHFIESGANMGNLVAQTQFQFIYAFHMPLFFLISGFYFKSSPDFYQNFKKLFLRRLLPVFSFAVLLLPMWIIYYYFAHEAIDWYQLMGKCLYYLKGSPQLNLITWFLVCLFSCEILASLFLPVFKQHNRMLVFFGMIVLVLGLFISNHIELIEKVTGIDKNTWFIHESIVALGFYTIGYATYPRIQNLSKNKKWMISMFSLASLAVLVLTFNLNQPYSNFSVLMINSNHGFVLPFLISAFAGILFIVTLGMLLPSNRIMSFIGQNTLILLGLNGIFHHFLNTGLVEVYFPQSSWSFITLYSLLITISSISLCYPAILMFNKYLPQFFGKSYLHGPIFPSLEETTWKTNILNKKKAVANRFEKLKVLYSKTIRT